MAEFVRVADASELHPGEMKRVLVDGQRVLLANVEGTFYALGDRCGHMTATLSKGKLEGDVVECPMHFARFNVKTGSLIRGPDFIRLSRLSELRRFIVRLWKEPRVLLSPRYVWAKDVPSFEVRTEGEAVLVKP